VDGEVRTEAAEASGSWLRRRTGGLDSRYWRLWGAVASSNIGDGFAMLAFPWLASLLTRDPVAIAGVALATRLPWLLFSLQAGVLTDVFDRRRLMVIANTLRAVVAAGSAAAVVFDVMSLPALYLAAFLLGMCEVVFDNTSQAILPSIVQRDRLERANGNIMGAQMVIADFVARPLAGAAIGLSLSLPFAIDAVTAAVSAALIASIPGTFRGTPAQGTGADGDGAPAAPRPRLRGQIAERLRWLWRHRLLRTLALALGAMNGTSAMMLATFVLFVQEILLLDGFGFGLLHEQFAAQELIEHGVLAEEAGFDMVWTSDRPRASSVTRRANPARYMAAWPAEFPPLKATPTKSAADDLAAVKASLG
jgi:hypothetical protein